MPPSYVGFFFPLQKEQKEDSFFFNSAGKLGTQKGGSSLPGILVDNEEAALTEQLAVLSWLKLILYLAHRSVIRISQSMSAT